MLDYLDSLTPAKGKNRYHCPVCEGNDLTVNPDTGAYSCHHGCTSEQIRNAVAPLPKRAKPKTWSKPRRPKSCKEWVYCDRNEKPLIKVNRTDSGNGSKRIWQTPLIQGKEAADLLPLVMPYRYQDCLAAIERSEPVLWVEGETTADTLWSTGIAATTTIRGSDGYRSHYSALFTAESVVICPDRDKPGLKYAEAIAQDYPAAQWLYAEPDNPEWESLPASGGFDLQDWIAAGATKEQILGSIEARRIEQPLASDDDDSVKDELDGLNRLNGLSKPQVLPTSLHTALSNLAERLNLPVEAYVSVLLSVTASQIHPKTRLALDPSTGFYAPPILWMGVVGESGTKKSPLLRAITSPLDSLQEHAEIKFQDAMDDYEQKLLDWDATPKDKRSNKPKPPIADEYYLSDFTMEALSGAVGNQKDRGLLINIDEIARFFSSMDAYRNGKGGDRQHWLSFYDGGAFKSNRKSTGRVYARHTSISLTGGIQPSILQKIWGEDKSSEDGLWSRFAWVRIPLSISPGIGEAGTYDLSGMLTSLYQRLAETPEQTFTLSYEAKQLWNDWHHEIEQSIIKEPSGILRATYPKAKERAARIALVTHLIDAVLSNKAPELEISAARLQQAIEFTRWLMGQTRLMYAEFGVADSPETARILKFVNRFRGCGWVNSLMVKGWWSATKKPSRQECRDFMSRICSLGYAEANDCADTDAKYAIRILEKPSPLSPHIPTTELGKDFEGGLKVSPNLVPLVPFSSPNNEMGEVHENGQAQKGTKRTNEGLKLVPSEIHSEKAFQAEGTKGTSISLKNENDNELPDSPTVLVGSKVTYGGLHVPTCQVLKDYVLTVTGVNCTVATVEAPELLNPVEVAIADLEVTL